MSGRLSGKICFVSAAAQGIGKATALKFAEEGATVIATDINEKIVEDLSGINGIQAAVLDVTKKTDVVEFFNKYDKIDVLFNCAGYVHEGNLLDSTDEELDFAFDLNVKSMFNTCKQVIPKMLANGCGSIINMSSACSSIKGVTDRCVYATTKAAVIGFTKSIAIDYVKTGIRCNAICPGTIETPSLTERIQQHPNPEQAYKNFISRQKMGRFGRENEVAALALYLAVDEIPADLDNMNIGEVIMEPRMAKLRNKEI